MGSQPNAVQVSSSPNDMRFAARGHHANIVGFHRVKKAFEEALCEKVGDEQRVVSSVTSESNDNGFSIAVAGVMQATEAGRAKEAIERALCWDGKNQRSPRSLIEVVADNHPRPKVSG